MLRNKTCLTLVAMKGLHERLGLRFGFVLERRNAYFAQFHISLLEILRNENNNGAMIMSSNSTTLTVEVAISWGDGIRYLLMRVLARDLGQLACQFICVWVLHPRSHNPLVGQAPAFNSRSRKFSS